MSCSSRLATLLFACLLSIAALAYNRPECDSWPSDDEWDKDVRQDLSKHARLDKVNVKGLADAYDKTCISLGFDPFQLANTSICLQDPKCAYQFCQKDKDDKHDDKNLNQPAYILTAMTPRDIKVGLEFANKHDIPVSVKTSGHAFHGGSTAKDSLLIWMHKFQKGGRIKKVTECCGKEHTVITIGGGEMWDDVLYKVKDDYHLVTGFCHTVGAAGGWLQGHGLSFTSRQYGLGIDQVLRFDLVLPNGTKTYADACHNEDLFWALRGGGGGTFGIVTSVQYKLHPATPITALTFKFDVQAALDLDREDLVKKWLDYWFKVSPTLDNRWGGIYNVGELFITFVGTRKEAMETFVNDLVDWYKQEFEPCAIKTPGISLEAPKAVEQKSWYQFMGGDAAHQNPTMTIPTGGDYNHEATLGSRLVPLEYALKKPGKIVELLLELAKRGTITGPNYLLGGQVGHVDDDDTATHPAVRLAGYNIGVRDFTGESYKILADYLPNTMTGASFNHHYVLEPDWRNALWGSNFDRLADLKKKYDPENRLNCWHCVGYQGPDPEDPDYKQPKCP
jgi:FAD/FMN-containing dehydrogenase